MKIYIISSAGLCISEADNCFVKTWNLSDAIVLDISSLVVMFIKYMTNVI